MKRVDIHILDRSVVEWPMNSLVRDQLADVNIDKITDHIVDMCLLRATIRYQMFAMGVQLYNTIREKINFHTLICKGY